ncbi:MAG TPA: 1-acyl-sn-glycerol-3-phosphate acyltransferase [Candidatus Egerieousia sp.]|nr:1-acyl-sn-glycerol-3-phosphate acyltransferase [Candidatus Egerieousia sp.]
MEEVIRKTGFFYRIIKWIINFTFNNLMFRRVYYMNTKNIPGKGTPLIIVENHQNCLVDAVAVLLSCTDANRKIHFITKTDIFKVNKYLSAFMRYIGVLSINSSNYEGVETVDENKDVFEECENLVAGGETVMLFPEVRHQNKRCLGDFSSGYITMAFNAAKKKDFLEDIFILPCANHYSRYYPIQGDMLIKFGTPISLKPYYELYKANPSAAQREVNELVRAQIKEIMLNITDPENYDAIDFLRTNYSDDYARKHSMTYADLPDKLLVDKQMVAALETLSAGAKGKNASASDLECGAVSSTKENIFAKARELDKVLKEEKISFEILTKMSLKNDKKIFGINPIKFNFIARCVVLAILFPFWIFTLWPAYFIYMIPTLFAKRINDQMLKGSLLLGSSAIITIPLFYLISFLLAWKMFTVVMAIIYVCLLPLFALFAWYYIVYVFGLKGEYRFYKNRKSTKLRAAKSLNDELRNDLWSALK